MQLNIYEESVQWVNDKKFQLSVNIQLAWTILSFFFKRAY